MQQYGTEDLAILDDPISVIRKRPLMYGGEMPRRPALAAAFMRDLVFLNALPASVEKIGSWWLISADKDRLMSSGSDVSLAPFFQFVPLPVAGQASHRTEILLNAFANAIVTSGSDGLTWISGDTDRCEVPARILKEHPGSGRYVAFRLDEP